MVQTLHDFCFHSSNMTVARSVTLTAFSAATAAARAPNGVNVACAVAKEG